MPKSEILQTRHVLAVNDLVASRDYYVSVLGFQIDFSVDGWEFLSRGSFRLMLGECPDDLAAGKIGSHAYFANVLVDDANRIFSEFKSNGAEFSAEIDDKPWGLREFCVLTPDGHRIVFAEEL